MKTYQIQVKIGKDEWQAHGAAEASEAKAKRYLATLEAKELRFSPSDREESRLVERSKLSPNHPLSDVRQMD